MINIGKDSSYMYIRSAVADAYSVTVNYLIVDGAGAYNVVKLLVYEPGTSDPLNNAVKSLVLSADSNEATISGLQYGHRYLAAIGNVTQEGDTQTFTQSDVVSFVTEEISTSLNVTKVELEKLSFNCELKSDFSGSGSFYVMAYGADSEAKVGSYQLTSENESAMKAGGYSGSMTADTTLDKVNDQYIVIALCYGTPDDNVATAKKDMLTYVQIKNEFK